MIFEVINLTPPPPSSLHQMESLRPKHLCSTMLSAVMWMTSNSGIQCCRISALKLSLPKLDQTFLFLAVTPPSRHNGCSRSLVAKLFDRACKPIHYTVLSTSKRQRSVTGPLLLQSFRQKKTDHSRGVHPCEPQKCSLQGSNLRPSRY